MEKDDEGSPRPLNNDGPKEPKSPWDFSGSGGGEEPKKGRGKSAGPVEEPKRPVNPWEQQTADDSKKTRKPSLEDLFRGGGGGGKKGSGFGGLPQRADGKSWWPVIVIGFAALWISWTSVHRLDSQEQGDRKSVV